MKNFILFIISFLLAIQLNAQIFHPLDVSVFENGEEYANPWAGGLNAPQWSKFDINNDGRQDLYAFDRNGNVHLSFINMEIGASTNYKYSRYWLSHFPEGQNYVLMRDYNRDGAADMFVSAFDEGLSGFKVYKGNFQNGHLVFDRILFPDYEYDIIPFYANGQVVDKIEVFGNQDYPAIDDLDGDGDLDILTMNGDASKVVYFKNVALESGYTDEVLMYELGDNCWGQFGIFPFFESLTLSTQSSACAFFTDPNDNNENDRVHGGSAICTFDNDNDGDKELLLGDLIFPKIIYAENGGNKDNAWMTSQDTVYPSFDVPVDIPNFPAPYCLDANNDGAMDLLISPNQAETTPDVETVWLYENEGTNQQPDFHFKQRDFIAETMLDFGTGAIPAFADVNADGLMDIVIGNRREWDSIFQTSYLVLMLNTGTETEPEYEVIDRDWLELKQYNGETWAFAPAFGDLDDDGDEDLLIGNRQGFIHFFENTAGAGSPMQFAPPQFQWKNINVGTYSTPFIHDVNKDGLKDLIIGERLGTVNYFQNIGTTGNPEFHPTEEEAPNNHFFGEINTQIGGSNIGFSQPVVLEFSEESFIVTGSDAGWLKYYKINTDSLASGSFELVNGRLGHWREGFISRIAFANITNNNYLDAIIGNNRGGVSIFQSPISINGLVNDHEIVLEKKQELNIYPNPAKETIAVEFNNINAEVGYDFKVFNSIGQVLKFGNQQKGDLIEIGGLPTGSYFLQIEIKGQIFNKLFTKL